MSGRDDLLTDLVAFVRRYIVLSPDQALAVALWVVHTHAADVAEFTPYLAVTSAEKRSGKTALLDLVGRLVRAPLAVANTSPAALYRSIEKDEPTLLFDEVDSIFGRNVSERAEELRGVLNAGFRRGPLGTVLRTTGPTHTPTRFAVFCPKALAGIGTLPDTLADRSIAIRMKRKTSSERVESMRARDVAKPADEMRAAIVSWVAEHRAGLEDARPELPDGLDDRAADIWEPLLTVAEAAGPEWATAARSAAVALSAGRADAEASHGIRLLADVRRVFDEDGADRMTSGQLCDLLNGLEESPWGGWREGRGIDPRTLARRLREYEVAPGTIRLPDGSTPKGYQRSKLADAWARYAASAVADAGEDEQARVAHLAAEYDPDADEGAWERRETLVDEPGFGVEIEGRPS